MDNGWRRGSIFPSVGGRTPSRTMIFIRRLQKGRHVHAADRVAIFPMVWKMWAQMSIGTPLMKSHRNCTLPRLMNAVFESGQRLKNMINLRVVRSGAKLCSAFGCTFAWNLMIRPKNLKNVLYLKLSIIIRSEVYICRSSDAKNLYDVVWIDGKLFSSYPTLQLNSGVSSIWIEFLNQFINRVLEVLEQINPIFCFKYPRNKCCSQGIKFYNPFHHSRSIYKNAWEGLWIEKSLESLTVRSLRMSSLLWNRGWWNISYRFFSSRGTTRHLQNSIHTAENQVQNHETQV